MTILPLTADYGNGACYFRVRYRRKPTKALVRRRDERLKSLAAMRGPMKDPRSALRPGTGSLSCPVFRRQQACKLFRGLR